MASRGISETSKSSKAGEHVEVDWQFINRKDPSLRDRVFLLLQGKRGPAIIGLGRVASHPNHTDGRWRVPIEFEALVDPATDVLASRADLLAMDVARSIWRVQASGVRLQDAVAAELEKVVARTLARGDGRSAGSNPDWTRDELILALSFYLKHRPNPPGKNSVQIAELSKTLNRLGEKLFAPEDRANTVFITFSAERPRISNCDTWR